MCGMIRPIQPTMPATEIIAEVARTAATIITKRSRRGAAPREKAVVSSKASRFKRQRKAKMSAKPARQAGSTAQNLSQVRLASPPSIQKVISGSWRSGSAKYLTIPSPAENSAETAMPASTRRSSQLPTRMRRASRYEKPSPVNAKIAAIPCTAAAEAEKKTIAKAAPKAAPCETPRNPGSTKGLAKII